jgi:hypothetical protein
MIKTHFKIKEVTTHLHITLMRQIINPCSFSDRMEITDGVYYLLLTLVIVPIKLFFDLWALLGWELFKNN